MSQLKFDGEGEISIVEHTYDFSKFFESHEINCEYVACKLFILTFEGQVKLWCHTLPYAAIHSFMLENYILQRN